MVSKIFVAVSLAVKNKIIKFAHAALKSEKVGHRSMAIELVVMILMEKKLGDLEIDGAELLLGLASRARDSSNIVQARALIALSDVLEGNRIIATDRKRFTTKVA